MHVLVTGATGLIGRASCAALLERGHAVTAVSRARDAAARLPAGLRLVAGDPAEPGPWQDALAAADACLHLAGEPIAEGRWSAEKKRRIRASRVRSTGAVAAVLRERGPEVLVSGSAVGFYGTRGDEVLDESSAPGEGFLADVCREWEAAAAPAASRARVVLLRTGVVLAREGGALVPMRRAFSLGLGGRFGDGRQWFPWIQVDDLVALIRTAIDDPRLRGPVNAVAPNPVRNAELVATLASALRRPALFPVPAFVLRAALGELAGELLGSRRVVPERANALGFRFHAPTLESALEAELG